MKTPTRVVMLTTYRIHNRLVIGGGKSIWELAYYIISGFSVQGLGLRMENQIEKNTEKDVEAVFAGSCRTNVGCASAKD